MRFGSHYTSTKYIANPTPIDFIPSRVHGLGEGGGMCICTHYLCMQFTHQIWFDSVQWFRRYLMLGVLIAQGPLVGLLAKTQT